MHGLLPAIHGPLLAALNWNFQIRGFLILATGILVLPGSVFLLLSTNTGAKLGFMLAVAGFTGWLFALSLIWILYGTGMKGNPPTWRVREIVQGDLVAHGATPALSGFPNGWTLVPTGNSALASAQSAADRLLTPVPAGSKPAKYAAPFKTTQDYVPLAGYTKGGNNFLFRLGSYKVKMTLKHHHFFIKHQPHYFVIRVQGALTPVTVAGVTSPPAADPTQPVISVVMIRDVGSLRFPNMMICLSAFLIFAVSCSALHRRDKEIMRQRALAPAAG